MPAGWRSSLHNRRAVLNSKPTCAFLTVGDSVVAEVDDIVGSVGEPSVTFLVRAAIEDRHLWHVVALTFP